MKLSKDMIRDCISTNLKEYEDLLTMRISFLMEQLSLFEKHEDHKVDLFELLVRVIFLADEGPAESIANLMVPLNSEASYLLESNTISESASFLRDFLKRDYIFYILKEKELNRIQEGLDFPE